MVIIIKMVISYKLSPAYNFKVKFDFTKNVI